MSQKAIKKKTSPHQNRHVVRIPIQPLQESSYRKEPVKSLPEKSFPLNKFIALPQGLRPKTTSQNSESSSPRRTTPVKAVAVPAGTSSFDSRAQIYLVGQPEARVHTVSNGPYTADISPHQSLHNTGHQLANGYLQSGHSEEPDATSTPRTTRRESQKRAHHSAHSSPRGSADSSPRAHVPNGSISSVGSNSSNRKRIYQKRSSSAPPDNRQARGVVDTDFVLNRWDDSDSIPGLSRTVAYHSVQDGVVIDGENWTRANIGHSRQVYRTNSVASGQSSVRSNSSFNTYSSGSTGPISNLEFTDVCNLNPDSSVESYGVASNGLNFIRSDTVRGDYAGVNTGEDFSDPGSRYSNAGVHLTSSKAEPSHKFVRSWSDLNLYKISMADPKSGQKGLPRTYTVNGAVQTGIVIYQPGKKEKVFVNDQHGPGGPHTDLHFLTVGRKQGTLMQSKMKFSSMPSLNDSKSSKGDKKLMKLLKKQEKEEKRRKEKEEKKRAKEEKKRIKMEKKLKTKTLPRNFAYQNGSITNKTMENIYRRPMLSMSTVPIDFEDGPAPAKSYGSKSSAPPTVAPPPLPGPSSRTMSMYASAPDLQRIEQIYGATIRGVPKEFSQPISVAPPSDYSPRSVVLQRAAEGYGFVLRGAKSQLKPNGDLDFRPTPEFPALQYLDSVDPRSVSDKAGLKPGDFILEINGENVVRASHDRVVHLIRGTGDTLAMKVVTVKPAGRAQDWFAQQDKAMTMPNRKKKAPAPPQRDPRTSLSISRSEGGSMSEELAVMESLDQAIIEKKMSEEKKTASIRSRTAAKRVSCVELDNIGIQSQLERSKSTPDLLDGKSKTAIYATPVVPGSTANGSAVTIRPKAPPPAPPGEGGSPKKQAPRPPSATVGAKHGTEVVTINTSKPTQYASVTVHVNKDEKKTESPYESSFRPGDSAKMSDDPSLKDVDKDEKQNVSFAEDKVLDHAASFLKKHPNAKLLITTEAQKKVRNRTSGVFEPEPDYDDDSGEDKPASPVKIQDKRSSVTVISVGQKKQAPPSPSHPPPSSQSSRYTIHSTIPTDEPPKHTVQSQAMVIPPRPDGPAPTPPNQSTRQQIPRFPAPAPPVAKVQPLPDSTPPYLPQTPPPEMKYEHTVKETVPSGPPPPPPPPPPAPPAPNAEQLIEEKSNTQTELTVKIPVHSIAAAVAKRNERIEKEGLNVNTGANKPKPVAAAKNDTQAAILAAVARRREKLEQQSENRVVDDIETRLQKTKKLQAARFHISSSKSPRRDTDVKSNENVEKKANVVQSSETKTEVRKTPVVSSVQAKPAKQENKVAATEIAFKVKPVSGKPQSGITEIKPKITTNSSTSKFNGTSSVGVKKQESLKVKTQPLEKTIASEVNAKSDNEKPQELNKTNGQSDFLALAEKKRQEYLQRKQRSAEQKSPPDSKSSSVAGTPEHKINQNKSSPPVSAKPKSSKGAKTESYTEFQSPQGLVKVKTVTNVNGETTKDSSRNYTNVPPPPPGFRDGGHIDNAVVQLEIIPPPAHFSGDSGVETSNQHSPAFSPDTASLVSSLSTLSSLSGDQNEGRGNGYDDLIAPPPPGFDDNDAVIAPPPQFGNEKRAGKFSDKPVESWLCIDVLNWLDSLKLSQYKDSFQQSCIDGKKLAKLTRNNYIELGVTQVAHRMNIERAIKKASHKPVSKDIVASEHL